jgi:MinD superfamily P-loop ATPase
MKQEAKPEYIESDFGTVNKISPACTLCKACSEVCPTKSIFFGRAFYVIDSDTCHGCGICTMVCPVDAIHPLEKTK